MENESSNKSVIFGVVGGLVGLIVLVIILAACGAFHQHEWQEATCKTPKTCVKCGKTEGEPREHTWRMGKCVSCGEADEIVSIDVTYTDDANPLYGCFDSDFDVKVNYKNSGANETSNFELIAPDDFVPGQKNMVTIKLDNGATKDVGIDVPSIRYFSKNKQEFADEFVRLAGTAANNYYNVEYSYASNGTLDQVSFWTPNGRFKRYEAFLRFNEPSTPYYDSSKVLSASVEVNVNYNWNAFDKLKLVLAAMTTPAGGLSPESVHMCVTADNNCGTCISRGDNYIVKYKGYRGSSLSGIGETHYVRADIVQGNGDGSES